MIFYIQRKQSQKQQIFVDLIYKHLILVQSRNQTVIAYAINTHFFLDSQRTSDHLRFLGAPKGGGVSAAKRAHSPPEPGSASATFTPPGISSNLNGNIMILSNRFINNEVY